MSSQQFIKHRHARLEELQATIDCLREDRWSGAVVVRETAMAACARARAENHRLFEAEAILLLGRTFNPMVFPAEAHEQLMRAAEIFGAHGQREKMAACLVAAARALVGMGRDRDAMTLALAALEIHELPADHRTAAYELLAFCHGHLGEMPQAMRWLTEHALPWSEQPGAHWTRPHVRRTEAVLRLKLLLARIAPGHMRELPEGVQPLAELSSAQQIFQCVSEGRRALPPNQTWDLLELPIAWLQGITMSSAQPVLDLQTAAERARRIDPPTTCIALFCLASVLMHRGELGEALKHAEAGLAMAQSWGLTSERTNLSLAVARVHDALGNADASLRAYKAFWSAQAVGALHALTPPRHTGRVGPVAGEGSRLEDLQSQRDPRPEVVLQAERYIDQHLSEKFSVDDVARHCKVSRRTLETTFKRVMACTLARHLKRRRLAHAAELLRHTNGTIQDVAKACGYASPAAFSRDFASVYGASPSHWDPRR